MKFTKVYTEEQLKLAISTYFIVHGCVNDDTYVDIASSYNEDLIRAFLKKRIGLVVKRKYFYWLFKDAFVEKFIPKLKEERAIEPPNQTQTQET